MSDNNLNSVEVDAERLYNDLIEPVEKALGELEEFITNTFGTNHAAYVAVRELNVKFDELHKLIDENTCAENDEEEE